MILETMKQEMTLENTRTINDLIENAGRLYGDNPFLRYEKNEIIYEKSYEDLLIDSSAIASWVNNKNKEKKDKVHVAILGKCSYEFLVSFFGIIRTGAVAIPLDVNLPKETLVDYINRSDVDVIFYDWEHNSHIDIIKERCPRIDEYICMQDVNHIECVENILDRYRGYEYVSDVQEEECAIIIFTSGTTGRGKGVMLSHRNLIDNAFCSNEKEKPGTQVFLNVLPIHHIFCINGDVLMVVRYGNILCINNELSKMLYSIKLFAPTAIRVVPMMAKVLYNKIAITLEQNPFMTKEEAKEEVLGANLHKIISGGGYLSEELARNYADLGIVIGQGYGMSECSPKISVPDYSRLDKLSSVGRIVDRCSVRVVDGEIQVKSPSVMMGYYKEPDKTAEVITEDGYLRTGDLGFVDEENFLHLTGRKKNLIILSNGENVSPEAIENIFDGELLISEILVYGAEDVIAAEIYPNYKYASVSNVDDIEDELRQIINKHNKELPSYQKISQFTIRTEPFEKTSSKKIIRQKFFDKKISDKKKLQSIRKPETELQQKLYDIIRGLVGNKLFGIDENIYDFGLDSLGSVLLIEEIHNKLNKVITFNDLLENNTILKIENYLNSQREKYDLDLSKREVYPLTGMQKYFAYIIKGNTTGNLPFTFKLSNSVDLKRLKRSIEKTIDIHPGLKAIIKLGEKGYSVYRDDSRVIDIPIINLTEAEWKDRLKEILVPYAYTEDDNLFHIYLFKTEEAKYLFFDVAHIMGDGITMNILLEDVNKIYCGEAVEKESYTFYEYILEEQNREKMGIRPKNLEYFDNLLKGIKLNRSILNKKNNGEYLKEINSVINKRFNNIVREEVINFCKKNGISENVIFLTAFNYCISLFSDEKDVFSNSIHSGRTDSRWTRLAGPLFLTYYCRYTQVPHERVIELLKKTSKQIMNTMQCFVAAPREGEMFFQFQGDILNINKIGDAEVEKIKLQLDSLPFHMQVMYDDKGYYTELRYYENRFDREQLEIFLQCYENILIGIMQERSVRRLKNYLPQEVFPKHFYTTVSILNRELGDNLVDNNLDEDLPIKVYVLDDEYNKKPYGAYGRLFIMDYKPFYYDEEIQNPYGIGTLYRTNKIARILKDGSVDFLENSGKVVLTDGIHGRKYYDLKSLNDTLLEYNGIEYADSYLCYDKNINEMSLIADIKLIHDIDIEALKNYIEEKCSKMLVPSVINKIN
ncbi:AMP-binding protein [Clostridium sp. MSJ-8]|uniref:AMP-binding protein n=1 Tax=Clostridium sp. MSJ-8 TaxID=2841510 RepID=UPI001C0F2CA7|nr:AMP-binding protein [Clostridium sp. MSJ-8]MBU5488836.1 AMP-binding protein [Clostridium sp. MSJ-8]